MAILNKQRTVIGRIQDFTETYIRIIELAYELKQSFPELYASSQDYSLDPDNQPAGGELTEADLTALGVNYTDLATFANQPIENIINFHEGSAVNTREYGKDVRAIRR